MKRLVFVVTVVLLAMAILTAGCTKATPKEEKMPTQNVTGTLKDVNTPKEAGQDAITVQTPQGSTSINITPQTGLSFDGKACTVDELDAKIAANTSYNCTIVFDPMLGAVAVYVTGP